jgi:hypothetical protein
LFSAKNAAGLAEEPGNGTELRNVCFQPRWCSFGRGARERNGAEERLFSAKNGAGLAEEPGNGTELRNVRFQPRMVQFWETNEGTERS